MSSFFLLFVLSSVTSILRVLLLEWAGIATQAAADKTSLKAQLDKLVAEKTELASKVDALIEEVARLKAESSKAQELANQHRLEAESKEETLHERLQAALETLRGKPLTY
jgi:peptidoglycan hydrolase CwlO-like protein